VASEIGGNFSILFLVEMTMDLLKLVVILDLEESVYIITGNDERIGVQGTETDLVDGLVHSYAEVLVSHTLLLIPKPDDQLVIRISG